jgi:hypothetical protein
MAADSVEAKIVDATDVDRKRQLPLQEPLGEAAKLAKEKPRNLTNA